MATLLQKLTVEMAEFHDALDLLAVIHDRLAKRHGDAFRKLDRDIERFMDSPGDSLEVHSLGEGRHLAAPAGRLTEIFRQARALGLTA